MTTAKANISPAPRGTLVVGRIQSYIDHPDQLLPVSCTVGVLENSLLGKYGLAGLMRYASQGLRFGAGVALHVSEFKTYQKYEKTYRFYINPAHPDAHQFSTSDQIEPSSEVHVIKVADSMQEDGEDGSVSIERSWEKLIEAYIDPNLNKEIVIDLSALRETKHDNGKGLVASGPGSFALIYDYIAEFLESPSLPSLCQIFSGLNEVLRRGGLFKNGAITIHFDYDQEGAADFVRISRSKTNWARLCLNIDDKFLELEDSKINHFLRYVSRGDVFLVKRVYDKQGRRIRHNVCLEILLLPFATCLLSHLNLGLLKNKDLVSAGVNAMQWLCELQANTGVENSEFYLPPSEDKQVGLGLVGMSNGLAIRDVKYIEFVEAAEVLIHEKLPAEFSPRRWNPDFDYYELKSRLSNDAYEFASALFDMYTESAKVARSFGMERAFTVAPTASCSFRGVDSEGYVTSPEIAPPLDLVVDRESETMDVVLNVQYHPDAEVAEEVGYETHFRLNCIIQTFMDSTGLAHSISFNWWSDKVVMNKDEIGKFIQSPLLAYYYAMPVSRLTQDKSRVSSEIGNCDIEEQKCTACGE